MTVATILVLAKEPLPGRVKTRLCPPCSPADAAAIAAVALETTLRTVANVVGVRRVLVLDGAPGPWLPDGFEVVPQVSGDLGDRLAGAFAVASTGPTVLVGMDTPHLDSTRLRGVVDALLEPCVDAVLGLTTDGGWWTIGVRDPALPVFAGVPMSTTTTGGRQRERLVELELRTELVGSETDVDDFASACFVASLMPNTEFSAVVGRIHAHVVSNGTPP